MKNQKGFSLVELLVVVIIIAIIAAIAIPNLLRSRRSANESTAIANLRTIHTANATYAATVSASSQYAATLAGLTAPNLLDSSWTDGVVKNTYKYNYTVDSATAPAKFCVKAISADTGARDFGIDSGGTISQNTTNNTLTCAAGDLGGAGNTVLGAN